MPTSFLRALVLDIAMLAAISLSAHAGDEVTWRNLPRDITLDIDRDGKPDRALLIDTEGGSADLYIYLGAGDGLLDPSRKPDVLKKSLTASLVHTFEANKKGSLVIMYGCGGCANTTATTLTIVHRDGAFRVGGYSYGWDTRDFGTGTCDINFLTGKGTLSKDGGRTRPIRAALKPVTLADWSEETHVRGCGF